ncbi:MAG: class I SAM-dependent methyltransferase [Planctomycetota bacterium]|nr:class I SAM-dependent methyltransferase [Planctomycetota bacterium]
MNIGDPSLSGDTDYRDLFQDLAGRYPLITETIDFGAISYFFTRVENPGELPVDLVREGELRWQPYWAEEWTSSRAICKLISEGDFGECSILDLGCGLGLAGTVAASRGSRVTFADNAEPALEFSKINCWNWRANCRFEFIDWCQEQSTLESFDIILGAEIIYDSADWDPLDDFWKKHLNRDGRVLLCDPFRDTGREFRNWIQNRQWSPVFSELLIPELEKPVNIMELKFAN